MRIVRVIVVWNSLMHFLGRSLAQIIWSSYLCFILKVSWHFIQEKLPQMKEGIFAAGEVEKQNYTVLFLKTKNFKGQHWQFLEIIGFCFWPRFFYYSQCMSLVMNNERIKLKKILYFLLGIVRSTSNLMYLPYVVQGA